MAVTTAVADLGPALAELTLAFTPSTEALRSLAATFQEEVVRGLDGRGSSLRMLPTFAEQPRGDERGRVLVVDWGGTHVRVGAVDLAGRGEVEVVAERTVTFTESEKVAPAALVFDAIASGIGQVAGAARRRLVPLGFVYSFPARLERIDRAIALGLTKGWRLAGLEGEDIVGLLQAALRRAGVAGVVVNAVANDAVAPLVLHTYHARGRDPAARPAEIGLILGTGTNLAAELPGAGIRNMESGNFSGVRAVETPWDAALDREVEDPAPGAQRLEKMVSGAYLGEIARRVVAYLAGSTGRFRGATAAPFRAPFAFDTANLSLIAADRSRELSRIGALLRRFGVDSSAPERRTVRRLAALIVGRSARLVAACLIGTLGHIDRALEADHVVAVDGSLYGGYPGYAQMVRGGLEELVGRQPAARIRLAFVKDSTSAGAAIIAAVAARREAEALGAGRQYPRQRRGRRRGEQGKGGRRTP